MYNTTGGQLKCCPPYFVAKTIFLRNDFRRDCRQICSKQSRIHRTAGNKNQGH